MTKVRFCGENSVSIGILFSLSFGFFSCSAIAAIILDNNIRYSKTNSQTIAFRVSPEENEQINFAVSLSGMTKQDYITNKLLDREIHVKGNSRIHKAIFDRLDDVLRELKRIENGAEINDAVLLRQSHYAWGTPARRAVVNDKRKSYYRSVDITL